jgi:hypothetical protein
MPRNFLRPWRPFGVAHVSLIGVRRFRYPAQCRIARAAMQRVVSYGSVAAVVAERASLPGKHSLSVPAISDKAGCELAAT